MTQAISELPTGAGLCAALAGLDVVAVVDDELLAVASAAWRQLACAQAQVWDVLAVLANRAPAAWIEQWDEEQVFENAVDELRAELLMSRRAARRELEHAAAVTALPRVAAGLRTGKIDRARAIVFADACWDLTEQQAELLLDELLPGAGDMTPAELGRRARRVAVALDPAWARRRYREAVGQRRVIGYLNEDGSATVSGQGLPADGAAAACARLDAVAAAAKRAGASASSDHLRVELFLGLLDGSFTGLDRAGLVTALLNRYPKLVAPEGVDNPPARVAEMRENSDARHGIGAAGSVDARSADNSSGVRAERISPLSGDADPVKAGVHVRVGLASLLGLAEEPGELVGWGSIIAPVARDLAARQRNGEWRYAIHDSQGQLIRDGLLRTRPDQHREPSRPVGGGVVELLVPATLITGPDATTTAARHPAWRRVLGELAGHLAARQRESAQRHSARFAGAALRRHAQTRFNSCVGPGCRLPATACQIDHTLDHARGGPTAATNTAPLCGHDHDNKTRRGWRLVRLSHTRYRWRSPLGRWHDIAVRPVAPPLPAPVPRPAPPVPRPVPPATRQSWACPDNAEPAFLPLDRRGRPLRVPRAAPLRSDDGADPPF